MTGMGRPFEHAHLLENLSADTLYSARRLANRGWEQGLLDEHKAPAPKTRDRATDALRKIAARYLPAEPDGLLSRASAWYGKRWMEVPAKVSHVAEKARDKRRALARAQRNKPWSKLVAWYRERPGQTERTAWFCLVLVLISLLVYREHQHELDRRQDATRAFLKVIESRD